MGTSQRVLGRRVDSNSIDCVRKENQGMPVLQMMGWDHCHLHSLCCWPRRGPLWTNVGVDPSFLLPSCSPVQTFDTLPA